MMTTCRLLCALFVLALCCCPSVCVTESSQVSAKDSPTPSVTQPQETGVLGAKNTSTTSSPAVPAAVSPGKGEGSVTQGSPGVEQALPEHPSEVAAPAGGPTIPVPITKEVPGGSGSSVSPGPVADTVQKNGDNDTTDSKIGNNPSTNQTDQEAENPAETTTTTTTTNAPTTTTTEATTTTTTRAPSRLREVDGSLSSSAWLCAPLLLSASALAYTTLG
ncbi:putative mucin TcMUCII [Trypanosoma cruzi]|nr:putative mucin TcMUCII [Trypanosoma cruzi]